MTSENVAKYAKACEALRTVGIDVDEFIALDMANCIDTWRKDIKDIGTADDILEMHLDTGYFKTVIEKGLAL